MSRLRVYWISNPPRDPIYFSVADPIEGAKLLRALARYDLYLGEQLVSSNVGGLEEWDYKFKEWCEWCNENGETLDEVYPQYTKNCDTTFDDDTCV